MAQRRTAPTPSPSPQRRRRQRQRRRPLPARPLNARAGSVQPNDSRYVPPIAQMASGASVARGRSPSSAAGGQQRPQRLGLLQQHDDVGVAVLERRGEGERGQRRAAPRDARRPRPSRAGDASQRRTTGAAAGPITTALRIRCSYRTIVHGDQRGTQRRPQRAVGSPHRRPDRDQRDGGHGRPGPARSRTDRQPRRRRRHGTSHQFPDASSGPRPTAVCEHTGATLPHRLRARTMLAGVTPRRRRPRRRCGRGALPAGRGQRAARPGADHHRQRRATTSRWPACTSPPTSTPCSTR